MSALDRIREDRQEIYASDGSAKSDKDLKINESELAPSKIQ